MHCITKYVGLLVLHCRDASSGSIVCYYLLQSNTSEYLRDYNCRKMYTALGSSS